MVEPRPKPLSTHHADGSVIERYPLNRSSKDGLYVRPNWENHIMVVGYGVIVKESGIPNAGNGLYVDRKVDRGQIITFYDGYPISADMAKAIKAIDTAAVSHFATWKATNQVIAGYRIPVEGVGGASFANADPDRVNAELVMDVSQGVFLVAARNLKAGEEVFIDYGSDYAIDRPEATMKGTPTRGVVKRLADVRVWRNGLFAVGAGIRIEPVVGLDGEETGYIGAFADAEIPRGMIFTWYDQIEIGGGQELAVAIEAGAGLDSNLLRQRFGESRRYARGIREPAFGAGGGSFIRVLPRGQQPNVTFEYAPDPKSTIGEWVIVVRSTRDIKKDEELLAATPDFVPAPYTPPPKVAPVQPKGRVPAVRLGYFGPGTMFYRGVDEQLESWRAAEKARAYKQSLATARKHLLQRFGKPPPPTGPASQK